MVIWDLEKPTATPQDWDHDIPALQNTNTTVLKKPLDIRADILP